MTPSERFNKKVEKTEGCWNWMAAKNNHGYGNFGYDGRVWKAHRFSYLIHIGDIPHDQYVCHRCDNPGCVNPDHLFLGTSKENSLDCRNKRRVPHKLKAEEVIEIRNSRETQRALAEKYGVSQAEIWRVLQNKRWVE